MTDIVYTREDTTFFKGIGIIMIVIHNYLHLIPGFGIENEATFQEDNAIHFFSYLRSMDFKKILGSLSGFLGHYGVQIFIFFSAYGLTIQYKEKKINPLKFVLFRLKKIYFLLGFGILFCIIYFTIIGQRPALIGVIKKSILLGSTLSSFSLELLYAMFSGPFWFFALIIQFYIIFPFLFNSITWLNKKTFYIIFLLVFGLIFLLYFTLQNTTLNLFSYKFHFALFGNIIGHLPETLLGISMAAFKFRKINIVIVIASMLIYIGSQMTYILFPFSFLSMTIVLLYSVTIMKQFSNKHLKKAILYLGKTSMILFIVNGPLRYLPSFNVTPDLKWERLPLYLFFLIILSHILSLVYSRLRIKFKV